MTQTDAALPLARFVATQQFESISADALQTVRNGIADTVGVMLAGSTTSAARAVRRLAALDVEGGSATVIGGERRLPAVLAAMCNGAAAHQFDFDDTHDAAVVHPTANTLPAALALAELRPGATGRELLTAIAVGNELTCRLGLAIRGDLFDYPWTRPPILGTFGAAAAAARLLGLDAERTQWALGFALHQTCNTLECLYAPGSEVRGLRDGFSVRNGITAALLAREGVVGDVTAFEGRFGLFNAFFRGEYDRSVLVDGLGARFHCADVSIKPWPSARETHATIHCALELREAHAIAADAIDAVVLTVGRPNLEFCEPGDQRRRPARRMDALSSLPFAVSVAFVRGRVGLESYTDAALRDPAVLAMAGRVGWDLDASIDEGTIEGGRVTVRLRDGSTLTRAVRHGFGHPGAPLPEAVRRAKFADCLRLLPGGADRGLADRLFDALLGVDDRPVADLTALLS
jgi:2-methylcitrate dehydratase PrpD